MKTKIQQQIHGDGIRLWVKGLKGQIVVTLEVDDEGYPVVDVCPEPTEKLHTTVALVSTAGDNETVLHSHNNRQLYITFDE